MLWGASHLAWHQRSIDDYRGKCNLARGTIFIPAPTLPVLQRTWPHASPLPLRANMSGVNAPWLRLGCQFQGFSKRCVRLQCCHLHRLLSLQPCLSKRRHVVEPGISDRLTGEGGLDLQHEVPAIQPGHDVDFPCVLLLIRRIQVEHYP